MAKKRIQLCIALCVILQTTQAFSQTVQSPNLRTSFNAVQEIQELQGAQRNVIVAQSELDVLIPKSGGGACPSSAVAILYQSARRLCGLDFDQMPHKLALQAFTDMPELLNGRLSNTQVVDLMKFYFRHMPASELSIEVVSAPNSPYATDGKTWKEDILTLLSPNEDQLKIMSYTVVQDDGHVLGRHFVLIKDTQNSTVSILNPSAPFKPQSFDVQTDQDKCSRVFLKLPPHVNSRGMTNELNTVFTITVNETEYKSKLTPTESTSVQTINSRLDKLATNLSERKLLKSPNIWREEGSDFGLPSLDLPSEYGGANWDASKMIHVFRQAGRHDLNLRDVVGAAHARILLSSKTPECRDILQQIADGKGYMAICITEPNAGSDFTSMETTAESTENGYVLNGQKRFNARLNQASHVIVFAKSPSKNEGRISCFVLPINAKGLKIETFEAHGLKGNSYGGLELNNVFVSKEYLIGDEDDGWDIFNNHFRYWRLMQTATAIGTAEKALDMMADRLRERQAFGGPIGRFTHLQQPMGQYATQLDMAFSLAKEAALLLDSKDYKAADPLINGLKAEGVEIALSAVDVAARAFGGEGYSSLTDIGDRLQDLQGLRIADGTTDVMRSSVVAKRFGKEFWEMAIEK